MMRQLWRTGLAAAAAMALGLGTTAEAQAQYTSSGCSTTWTTACASVSVFSAEEGDRLIVSAVNTSTDPEADALQGWLQVAVDPKSTLNEDMTAVYANCSDESAAQSGDFSSCDDISDYWNLKNNNQGDIDWEGVSTDEGNSGLVTDMEYCNNSENACWTGNVYFDMHFGDDVSFEQWAMQAQRLGEGDEYSDWISEVPEPMTTTLVGIGLAAGYAARRRRQGEVDFDEDGEDPGLA